MLDEIRKVIRENARLPVDPADLDPLDDLYQKGMTSHAGVNLMLALEEHFDVEFPDRMLTRAAFSTMASIEKSLAELKGIVG
jgi:acyl carrier protein